MSQPESCPDSRITASVERLRQELDRWLEFAVEQSEKAIDAIRPKGAGRWTPDVDVFESENEVLVVVDLPGVEPASVDVSLAGNMLSINGEKPSVELGEGQTVHHRERHQGRFVRSLPMPVPVNADAVSAQSAHGVLQIRLPKAERARAHKIQVGSAAGSTEESGPPPGNA